MSSPRINILCVALVFGSLSQIASAQNLYEDAVYAQRRAQQIEAAAKWIVELGKSDPQLDLAKPIQRIFGGLDSQESEMRACVAILDQTGSLICSGALIAPEIVAAPKAAFVGKTAEQIQVSAGMKHSIAAAVSKLDDLGDIKLLLLKTQLKGVEPINIANGTVFDESKENLLVGYREIDGKSVARRYVATPLSSEVAFGADANRFVAGEPASPSQNAMKSMGISVMVYRGNNYLSGIFEKSNNSWQVFLRTDKLLQRLEEYADREHVTLPTVGQFPPAQPNGDQKKAKELAKAELIEALSNLVKALKEN